MKTRKVLSVSSKEKTADNSEIERILAAAESRFFRDGFTATTIDALAADLGMSKATIYRLIPGKDWLIRRVVFLIRERLLAGVEEIMGRPGSDVMDRVVRLSGYLGSRFAMFNRGMMNDLRRNLPDLWAELEAYRRDKIRTYFKSLILSGRESSIFRSDVDPDIILLMFLALIERLITPETILRENVTAGELFRSIILVFFGGLLTAEGRRRFRDIETPDFRPFEKEA